MAIGLYVTGGGEHAAEQLISWLGANDDLQGSLNLPDLDGGPITAQVPDKIALRQLAEEIVDSLRSTGDATEIIFAGDNGRVTLTAGEVKSASEAEIDAIIQRIRAGPASITSYADARMSDLPIAGVVTRNSAW